MTGRRSGAGLAAPQVASAQTESARGVLAEVAVGTRLRYTMQGGPRIQAHFLGLQGDTLSLGCHEPCPATEPLIAHIGLGALQSQHYRKGSRAAPGLLIGAGAGFTAVAGLYLAFDDAGYAHSAGPYVVAGTLGVFGALFGAIVGRALGASTSVWAPVPLAP